MLSDNVTELSKSELGLPSTHQVFECIVQNSTDAIAITTLEGEIIRVNPAWERTYGWNAEEVVGRVRLFETDQSIQWREAAKLGCIVPNMEDLRECKDGASIYVSVTTSPIFDGQGQVTALCWISRDITGHVDNEKALIEARQQLESFIEQSADAISVTSLQGDLLRVNPAFERIFGWTKEEVVGQVNPFRSEAEQREIAEWLQRIQSDQRIPALETVRYRKDGTPVQVSITASPIHDQAGSVVAMSVISRDISSLVANKELLGRSEKLSLVGQMAAGVAHEIRNPLASLQGFAQLIREQTRDASVANYANIMIEEFRRINSIINEFLILAKPQKVQHQRKCLAHILQDVMTLIQTQANEKNLVLIYQATDREVFVDCNESELKQVFINILKNAVEATPAGRRIDLALLQLTNTHVLVRCTDEGCGIPKELVAKIGSPFFTTKASGTGLGLMVSQRIIESHGGRMVIQSEENAGTTVEVMLPVHHGKGPAAQTNVVGL